MIHHRRDYYQIYRVDYRRNQEHMVAEVEGLHEAEKIKRTPCASCTARRLQLQPDTARSSFSLSLVFAVFPCLLQLRVLRLGFLQDGDVGVGVFPEAKKLGWTCYCGSPTFRTNSANRGSERMGSSKKSVFKPDQTEHRAPDKQC